MCHNLPQANIKLLYFIEVYSMAPVAPIEDIEDIPVGEPVLVEVGLVVTVIK